MVTEWFFELSRSLYFYAQIYDDRLHLGDVFFSSGSSCSSIINTSLQSHSSRPNPIICPSWRSLFFYGSPIETIGGSCSASFFFFFLSFSLSLFFFFLIPLLIFSLRDDKRLRAWSKLDYSLLGWFLEVYVSRDSLREASSEYLEREILLSSRFRQRCERRINPIDVSKSRLISGVALYMPWNAREDRKPCVVFNRPSRFPSFVIQPRRIIRRGWF